MNNFYNEPPFADRVLELSRSGEIPETIQEQYVQTIASCFVGNGYGVSWDAESKYENMIQEFSPREIAIMIRLGEGEDILARRLSRSSSCKSRFKQALELIDPASVPSGAKADYDKFLSI